MTYSNQDVNMNQLYKKLSILRVEDHYLCETARFMHSVYHGSMPPAFNDSFNAINHNYSTRVRHQHYFSLPAQRTERGKRTVGYSGVMVWGKIPAEMKSLSKNRFKYELKKWIISKVIPET